METSKWSVTFDGKPLHVTENALKDFSRCWRYVEFGLIGNELRSIQSLLDRSVVEQYSKPLKGFEYYRNGKWRFIIGAFPGRSDKALVTVQVEESDR